PIRGRENHMARKQWFVIRGKYTLGPFSSAKLKELAKKGKAKPQDLVYRDDRKPTPASELQGLFSAKPSRTSREIIFTQVDADETSHNSVTVPKPASTMPPSHAHSPIVPTLPPAPPALHPPNPYIHPANPYIWVLVISPIFEELITLLFGVPLTVKATFVLY